MENPTGAVPRGARPAQCQATVKLLQGFQREFLTLGSVGGYRTGSRGGLCLDRYSGTLTNVMTLDDDARKPTIGYVFLREGSKAQSIKNPGSVPGASKQILAAKDYAASRGYAIDRWFQDHNTYTRAVPLLQPEFRRAARWAREHGVPILIESFGRLTRNLDPDEAVAELVRLRDTGVEIIDCGAELRLSSAGDEVIRFGIRQARRSTNLRAVTTRVGIERKSGAPRKPKRRRITRARLNADQFAAHTEEMIKELRAKMPEDQRQNLSALARALNEHGYTAARGGSWSAQTVRRSLKRADQYRRRRAQAKADRTADGAGPTGP